VTDPLNDDASNLLRWVAKTLYESRYSLELDDVDIAWAFLKVGGGFSDQPLALLTRGETLRKALYPDEDRDLLHLHDDGIHYSGNAPDHWHALKSSLPIAEHDPRRPLD
jgi:hypothetical protein